MDFYRLEKDFIFLISQKALILKGERLLILRNTAYRLGKTVQWELPGGLLKMKESLPQGLLREVAEETSLHVSIRSLFHTWDHLEYPFQPEDGRIVHARILELAFCCHHPKGEIHLSEEHDTFLWATKENLQHHSFSPNSQPAIQKYLTECTNTSGSLRLNTPRRILQGTRT